MVNKWRSNHRQCKAEAVNILSVVGPRKISVEDDRDIERWEDRWNRVALWCANQNIVLFGVGLSPSVVGFACAKEGRDDVSNLGSKPNLVSIVAITSWFMDGKNCAMSTARIEEKRPLFLLFTMKLVMIRPTSIVACFLTPLHWPGWKRFSVMPSNCRQCS